MRKASGNNTVAWIAGTIAACLTIGVLLLAAATQSSNIASNTRPTTGSGSVTAGDSTPAQPAKRFPNPLAPAAPVSNW